MYNKTSSLLKIYYSLRLKLCITLQHLQ